MIAAPELQRSVQCLRADEPSSPHGACSWLLQTGGKLLRLVIFAVQCREGSEHEPAGLPLGLDAGGLQENYDVLILVEEAMASRMTTFDGGRECRPGADARRLDRRARGG